MTKKIKQNKKDKIKMRKIKIKWLDIFKALAIGALLINYNGIRLLAEQNSIELTVSAVSIALTTLAMVAMVIYKDRG